MKHINFTIKNELGEPVRYRADAKIMRGLHLTKDLSKIQENCKQLNINTRRPNLSQACVKKVKVVILAQICVVTILGVGKKHCQFLIQKDFDLNNLKRLASKKINGHYHDVIQQAYDTMIELT